MRTVYLDNAATTQLDAKVFKEIEPYYSTIFGNPSGTHSLAHEAHKGIEKARERVSSALNCLPSQVIFTSGGTESNNFVLHSIAHSNDRPHIIVSSVEHHSILNTARFLENKRLIEATYLPVDQFGIIDFDQLIDAVRPNTALVSIMTVNNETGAVMPIKRIGEFCRERRILFHTDAVQALGHLPIDVRDSFVDFLSVSAHKIYGPKGAGALFIGSRKKLTGMIHGGIQEFGIRAGTENVPGIVGLGKAAELSQDRLETDSKYIENLSGTFMAGIRTCIPDTEINCCAPEQVPNIVSVTFNNADKNALLYLLDKKGICASGGAACAAGTAEPSHVLKAMGFTNKKADSTIRFSFSRNNTMEDIDYVLDLLPEIVSTARY